MIKTGYDRATSLFVEYYKFCLVDKGSYKMVVDFSVIISTTFTQEIKPPCLAFLQGYFLFSTGRNGKLKLVFDPDSI